MSEAARNAPPELVGCLLDNEAIAWWDRPDPWQMALREGTGGLLIGIGFVAFPFMTTRTEGEVHFLGFLLVVALFLLGLRIISDPFRTYRRAKRTLLMLTDRRALIIDGRSSMAFPLEHISFVEAVRGSAGKGNVHFHRSPGTGSEELSRYGFVGVQDPDRVAATMLDLIEARLLRSAAGRDGA